jgi:DNA polymerase I
MVASPENPANLVEPERVCDRLSARLASLRASNVPPAALTRTRRVSKELDEHDRRSRTTAALRRAERLGIEYAPGESVTFVVVDDGRADLDRVRLGFEEPATYDADHHAMALFRAAEGVLSPVGWRERRIRASLADRTDASPAAYR